MSSIPLLRLTSSQITVKHGTLNATLKINTNIPIGSAAVIRKVAFTVIQNDTILGSDGEALVSAQLTENTQITGTVLTDPLAIASWGKRYWAGEITAVGLGLATDEFVQSGKEDFGGFSYPSGAAIWLLVATLNELAGSFTQGWAINVNVFYSLESIAPYQAYINQKLALQR
jgi:hypothetical protein